MLRLRLESDWSQNNKHSRNNFRRSWFYGFHCKRRVCNDGDLWSERSMNLHGEIGGSMKQYFILWILSSMVFIQLSNILASIDQRTFFLSMEETTPMRICEAFVIYCPRDRVVDFAGRSMKGGVDKWRLSFAERAESMLERQHLRIYFLHPNFQVFGRNMLSLRGYRAHALSNRPNTKLLFECVLVGLSLLSQKSTGKEQAKFNTSDIPLFKSDQHLESNITKMKWIFLGLRRLSSAPS